MGRFLKFVVQWALCSAIVLLAVLGSKGSVVPLIRELSKPSHKLLVAQRTTLSLSDNDGGMKLRPSQKLAPMGIDVPPLPAISSAPPPNNVRASSPTNDIYSQNASAPSPVIHHTGFVTHAPSLSPPKFEDTPPPIHWPRPVSPSVESQAPNIPVRSGHDISPSSAIPPSAPIREGMPKGGAHGEAPINHASVTSPRAPVPSPPEKVPSHPPNMQPISAAISPSTTKHTPHAIDSPAAPPSMNSSPNIHRKNHGAPLAAPSPVDDPDVKDHSPVLSPLPQAETPSNVIQTPSLPQSHPPQGPILHSPAPAPPVPIHPRNYSKRAGHHLLTPPSSAPSNLHPKTAPEKIHHSPASGPTIPAAGLSVPSLSPSPFSSSSSSSSHNSGPVISPSPLHPPEMFPNNRHKHYQPIPPAQVPNSPIQAPLSPGDSGEAPAPSPSSTVPSSQEGRPNHSPAPSPTKPFPKKPPNAPFSPGDGGEAPVPSPTSMVPSSQEGRLNHSPAPSPTNSFPKKPIAPQLPPLQTLPPPPPNLDCAPLTCTDSLTNSLPGSPCTCVLPIKVGLRLSIGLYDFFPVVSELAQEISSGISMKQRQVRIMGANADTEEPEKKTVVIIYLVPKGQTFDRTIAYQTYVRFWHKQVVLSSSDFGNYDVLYVEYPGLPPSPPMAPANINADGSLANTNNARAIKPLGVDIRKPKENISKSLIAIIVLSSVIALILCVGAAWFLLLKCRNHAQPTSQPPQPLLPSFAKSAGPVPVIYGSRPSSASGSFGSSVATYTGSAKTFSLIEIERATNKFDESRIIGEGGFGRVYLGTFQDGTRVAVKVLKRDDQQGGREFLAEVEMLSRLHHRNLVKLIGICTEEHLRCLVYELIPNGSVESHLHGVDKESAPLDWNARMKIALGAARGLAYLHEDSSPRVIHRDFKSSNILLEHDFTPKVSDFGLARTALEEGNEHISTRVMGTFGYVAPEYAMTGHLLVKSDVYSYGVVLLELLTGRKPVDMSQPPGQENLVSWARPLLTSKEGLETIIDLSLGTDVPFDSVAKVAAIASMCVQPEVSHRPFMGEVVQALKLVCNEGDEYGASGSCSQEVLSAHETELRISTGLGLEAERVLSASDVFSTSARFTREGSGSFRRHSSSGPLRPGRGRQFWQRLRGLSKGSMSDHAVALRYVSGPEEGIGQWP
ncbi:Non-specific serine/threonine protein kinase protein [Dioscorea alata]|uniref:Non-specific serine/threonine protein kinase protein n=1 Tax=Dioscorea alata TaxID=55571 RepID=A0ACB7W3N8_DIOAL|nr:Non-specific serine/threonine protein kinase protein [Dioscorea alata]